MKKIFFHEVNEIIKKKTEKRRNRHEIKIKSLFNHQNKQFFFSSKVVKKKDTK